MTTGTGQLLAAAAIAALALGVSCLPARAPDQTTRTPTTSIPVAPSITTPATNGDVPTFPPVNKP